MQKLLGSVLVILATSMAGVMYGLELHDYVKKLSDIRRILQMIQGEIHYTSAPLGNVFYDLSRKVCEPYKSWLQEISRETELREEDHFENIWNKCVEQQLKSLHLKQSHLAKVKEFGRYFGRMDYKTLEQTGTSYLDEFNYEIQKLRDAVESKKRIANCIGIMSGIFIVILLL